MKIIQDDKAVFFSHDSALFSGLISVVDFRVEIFFRQIRMKDVIRVHRQHRDQRQFIDRRQINPEKAQTTNKFCSYS